MVVRNKFAVKTRLWLALFILLFVCSLYVAAQPPLPLMPRDGIELLENGSFEIDANEDRLPDGWTGKKTSHTEPDRRKCYDPEQDKIYAYNGECAFVFQGNPDGNSSTLQQTLSETSALTSGAQVIFRAHIDPRSGKPGAAFGKAQIQYSDGSIQKFELKIPDIEPRGSEDYVRIEDIQTVTIPPGATITKVTVKFVQTANSGKFMIDDTSFTVFSADMTLTPSTTPTPSPTHSPTNTPAGPWIELNASDGQEDARFGLDVAFSDNGKIALIGSNSKDAYIFKKNKDGWIQQAKLADFNSIIRGAEDFGYSVALSGDGSTALIASKGPTGKDGNVFVFTRSKGIWTQQIKLKHNTGINNPTFGGALALSHNGNVAIVGGGYNLASNIDSQGTVYIFVRINGIWYRQGKITASDNPKNFSFGNSVALSQDGTTAIIGAFKNDIGYRKEQGSAYIFNFINGAWVQQARFTASDGKNREEFGTSVELSADGRVALIGAAKVRVGDNKDQGAAYIFNLNNNIWTQTTKIIASDGVGNSQFGGSSSLNIDGRIALIGSTGNQSSAYIFQLTGTGWKQKRKLVTNDNPNLNSFGASVALNKKSTVAIVGAPGDKVGQNDDQGTVFVFDLTQP